MERHWYQKIAEYAKQDKAIPHFLKALYHIFSHCAISALTNIIGTVVIAILCAQTTKNVILIVIAAIVYIILIIGMTLCKDYEQWRETQHTAEYRNSLTEKDIVEKENSALVTILDSIRKQDNAAGNDIYRNARVIKHDGWISNIHDMRETFGFQKMAIQICNEIYSLLKDKFAIPDAFVSVYQRFPTTATNDVCQMIAYNLQNDTEPISYHHKYTIPKRIKEGQKIEYHTKIFVDNSTTIRTLVSKSEVEKAFVKHKGSEERESSICQYIGIPMNVCNRGITFILQVDCCRKDAFGCTTQEMESFAKLYLYQYASQLSLYYEMDRFVEVTDTYIQKRGDESNEEEK